MELIAMSLFRCELLIWDKPGPVTRDVLLEQVKNCNGLFCNIGDKIDAELLEAAGL